MRSSASSTQESSIYLKYTASEVNIVADSSDGSSILYVEIDGKPADPKQKGSDIEFDDMGRSFITITEPRLYNVFKGDYGTSLLKLTTSSDKFLANAFTFG